ncbi:DUF3800 domain-containing protein [Bacillus tianshenii]|nr:DUF3800 domain-containing protein [Bacillus tianshenii]
MNYDIYCDEAGNTGGNYLDPNQPIYVLSGWMIERSISYRAKNRIEYLKEGYYPQAKELKGAKILKRKRGAEFSSKLIEEMGAAQCMPFFIIAEKRYCVAAKMVEAYLDSEYNDRITETFSWMNQQKKNIAEIIYHISSGAIEKFAEAHNNPTLEAIKDAQLHLVEDLETNGLHDLAFAIKGSDKYMSEILEEETHTMNAMDRNALHTLNLPVFTSFVQMIESFSKYTGIKKIRMFHDEVAQFRKAYPETFQLYSQSANTEEFVLENGANIIFSIDKLSYFQMSDSKKNPLIQAADVLSSSLNAYCNKIVLGEEINSEFKRIGEFLVSSYIVNDDFPGRGFCDFIGSNILLAQISQSVDIIQDNIKVSLPEIDIKPYLKT